MAIAYIGLSPEDFWQMEPREFQVAMEAYREKTKIESQQAYELTRFNAFLNIQPHISEKSNIQSPQDLLRFEWESETPKTQSREPNEQELFKLRAMWLGKEQATKMMNQNN